MTASFRLGIALVASGGCAQLAGIDKTTGDNRQVSLVLDRVSIGTTVSTAPLALEGLTAAFLVPDANDDTLLVQLPAETSSDGLWTAKLGDGTPPALFTEPDGSTYLWALPSRTMHGAFTALEHAMPTPPPAGATVTVTGALDVPAAAGETFQFLEVGTWAQVALPTPAVGAAALGPATFTYANATKLGAPLPLAAMTPDDVVLVMRHAGGSLTGFGEIAPAGPQGGATAIDAPIAAVAHDQTLAMPLDPAAIAARFANQQPAPTTALALPWQITAAPGFARGSAAGPLLISGAATAMSTSLAAIYGNPFATTHMWPAALSVSAVRSRIYAPGAVGGPQITLSTTLNELTAPDASSPIALTAPLPLAITVGATPLAADDTLVKIDPTRPIPVSFTTDGMPAELYELELYELVAGTTAFTMTRTLVLASDTPSWHVPAAFLTPAHRYVFRAIAVSGAFASVDTGDLSTVMLPYASGSLDGGVFTVTL